MDAMRLRYPESTTLLDESRKNLVTKWAMRDESLVAGDPNK